MNKKLYISPEFEWLYVRLGVEVLSASLPDNTKDVNEMGDDDPPGGGEYGTDPGYIDPGDLI